MSKTCEKCRFCIEQDFGYSNYTFEGTTVYCVKGNFDEFDRWYGEDERLKVAETCNDFESGGCVEIDCDRESVPLDDWDSKEWGKYYSDDQEIADFISKL